MRTTIRELDFRHLTQLSLVDPPAISSSLAILLLEHFRPVIPPAGRDHPPQQNALGNVEHKRRAGLGVRLARLLDDRVKAIRDDEA